MGRPQAEPRDWPRRTAGRCRRAGAVRRDQRARHRGLREGGQARHRFLSADRQLPGEDLRRRQDSRRLFQARRPSEREGDADLAPHRPADPPAVRRRLQARDPGGHHRAVPRHGERPRHRRHGGGLGRTDAVGRAVPRPHRRRARRLHRRPVCPQSDDRRDVEQRPRSRRRRHRRCRHDGGVGGQGAQREADARGRHVRPSRLPADHPGDHQARREGGQGAVGLPARRQVQVRRQGEGPGRGRPAQGVRHAREAQAPRPGRGGARHGS